ncbi:unnamed protein product [Arabidopsis halleri]
MYGDILNCVVLCYAYRFEHYHLRLETSRTLHVSGWIQPVAEPNIPTTFHKRQKFCNSYTGSYKGIDKD